MPTTRSMLAIVAREHVTGLFVAHCLAAGTYSAGKTPEEALALLQFLTARVLEDDEEVELTDYDEPMIAAIEVPCEQNPQLIRS